MTETASAEAGITWDAQQEAVISADSDARLLVEAAPGAGKTEVACGRVAELIRRGLQDHRILLISFTNAAVQEIRERIDELLKRHDVSAGGVQLRTIDSLAGVLRAAYSEDDPAFEGYADNLEAFTELLRDGTPHLSGYIRDAYDHVLVDEAQDVTGIRRQALLEFFGHLDAACGITVFGDQAQAIYGWTDEVRSEDTDDRTGSLVRKIREERKLGFRRIELENQYRTEDDDLGSFFSCLRDVVTEGSQEGEPLYKEVREWIDSFYGTGHNVDADELSELVRELGEDALVLFRTKCSLALASSFLSDKGIRHRLRFSNMEVGLQPWIAGVFSDYTDRTMSRGEFDRRLDGIPEEALGGLDRKEAWELLYGLAGERTGLTVSALRESLGARKPPEALLQRELGARGPLLSTIHAAKGRQAASVLLLFPRERSDGADTEEWEEEARVLYVGATRPESSFSAGQGPDPRFRRLENDRVIRRPKRSDNRVQVHLGRSGDVDPVFSASDRLGGTAGIVQQDLLAGAARHDRIEAKGTQMSDGFRHLLREPDGTVFGALSRRASGDIWQAGEAILGDIGRPAPDVNNLWWMGSRTVVAPDGHEMLDQAVDPFSRTGFWLAPQIKGFPSHVYWR